MWIRNLRERNSDEREGGSIEPAAGWVGVHKELGIPQPRLVHTFCVLPVDDTCARWGPRQLNETVAGACVVRLERPEFYTRCSGPWRRHGWAPQEQVAKSFGSRSYAPTPVACCGPPLSS